MGYWTDGLCEACGDEIGPKPRNEDYLNLSPRCNDDMDTDPAAAKYRREEKARLESLGWQFPV